MPMHTTIAPRGLANLCRCEFNLVPLLEVTEIVNSCTSAATTQDSRQHPKSKKSDRAVPIDILLCDSPTPEEAIARLVRTYARKVRSEARWSRATLPEFSSTTVGFKHSRSFAAHAASPFPSSSPPSSPPRPPSLFTPRARIARPACDSDSSESATESVSSAETPFNVPLAVRLELDDLALLCGEANLTFLAPLSSPLTLLFAAANLS